MRKRPRLSRSERGVYLHPADSLASGARASVHLDVSPSTLIPYYDPDTSVVILTGKVSTQKLFEPKPATVTIGVTHCAFRVIPE